MNTLVKQNRYGLPPVRSKIRPVFTGMTSFSKKESRNEDLLAIPIIGAENIKVLRQPKVKIDLSSNIEIVDEQHQESNTLTKGQPHTCPLKAQNMISQHTQMDTSTSPAPYIFAQLSTHNLSRQEGSEMQETIPFENVQKPDVYVSNKKPDLVKKRPFVEVQQLEIKQQPKEVIDLRLQETLPRHPQKEASAGKESSSGIISPLEPRAIILNKVSYQSPQIEGEMYEIEENPYQISSRPFFAYHRRQKARKPTQVSITQMLRNIDYVNTRGSVLENVDPENKIQLKNRVKSLEMLPFQKYQMGKSMQKDYIKQNAVMNVKKFSYTEYY